MKKSIPSLLLTLAALAVSATASAQSAADIESMKRQLAEIKNTKQHEKVNLENFDDLDFNVYTGQKWDQLSKSHAKDIVVHYPDGHTTKGIPAHIEELKPMFIFAPNTSIHEHPIRIASGEWTAVQGVVEGTFSQPMPIGEGKTIPATGKSFKLTMVTIGHWNGSVMDEEWLMWDNQALLKQIGLAQ
ncbi:ester cyclase [Undibacterium sp. SXout11W]|uniref:ester cyclase n=1 Tax=Undibacterium sp. SXout11W TaxID=3413050 RepID=UPI003BF141D4